MGVAAMIGPSLRNVSPLYTRLFALTNDPCDSHLSLVHLGEGAPSVSYTWLSPIASNFPEEAGNK